MIESPFVLDENLNYYTKNRSVLSSEWEVQVLNSLKKANIHKGANIRQKKRFHRVISIPLGGFTMVITPHKDLKLMACALHFGEGIKPITLDFVEPNEENFRNFIYDCFTTIAEQTEKNDLPYGTLKLDSELSLVPKIGRCG